MADLEINREIRIKVNTLIEPLHNMEPHRCSFNSNDWSKKLIKVIGTGRFHTHINRKSVIS